MRLRRCGGRVYYRGRRRKCQETQPKTIPSAVRTHDALLRAYSSGTASLDGAMAQSPHVFQPNSLPCTQALSRCGDPFQEAWIIFQTIVKPIIVIGKANQ